MPCRQTGVGDVDKRTDVVFAHQATSQVAELAAQLEDSLGDGTVIRVVDLATATGNVVLPPSLLKSLQLYGAQCLPALVVDDVVVRQGRLPERTEALQLIGQPEPDPATDLELDRLIRLVQSTPTTCCSPAGGCSCN
ncbi:MAG: arsenic metallochaperone ArsD family protein [Chloroflexi bacterium]|nr:arsenic metallochaperone ArsD family protein [Chloroflexota bacterium]MBV9597014.1 arsenic metallochaperone ArsD family protein [Chloroflexota bacterium]